MRGYPLYVCAFFLIASMAFGQVGNGTITGTVTDPAGAVIPGAAVEAKNTATGVAFSAVSTSTGNYTVPDLPVGTYTVTVKAQGFKDLHSFESGRRRGSNPAGGHPAASRERHGGRDRHRGSYAAHDRNRRFGPQRHAGHNGPASPAGHWNHQLWHLRLPQSLQRDHNASRRERLWRRRALYDQRPGRDVYAGDDAHRRPGRDLPHFRNVRLHADGPAQRGFDSGNCVPDQQLRGRVRTGGLRGHQHDHEVRHQPVSRQPSTTTSSTKT